MIHKLYNPLELSSIMDKIINHLTEEKIIFSKEKADTVMLTFDLIVGFMKAGNQKTITVDQLKILKQILAKKYYNKKVILQ